MKKLKMIFLIQKFLFNAIINLSFLLILFIGIQNSSNKAKVNLLINETIELPISFILGISFISGSIIGGIVPYSSSKESKSSESY